MRGRSNEVEFRGFVHSILDRCSPGGSRLANKVSGGTRWRKVYVLHLVFVLSYD